MAKSIELNHLNNLHTAYHVAEADLAWINYGIANIKKELREIKTSAADKDVHPYTFNDLETFLQMLEFLMMGRLDYYSQEVEQLEIKIKKLKEGEAND